MSTPRPAIGDAVAGGGSTLSPVSASPAGAPMPADSGAGDCERSLRSGATTFALIAVSFAALLLGADGSVVNVYDEGDVRYGARQVLAGAVPYRDFWAIYGPAQYWTVAGLFKLLGASILTERIWDSLVRAALAATTYSIARRLTGRDMALVVWLLTLAWLWLVRFYGYPLLPAALFGLLAVAHLLRGGAESTPRWTPFVAGMLAGIAAIFRPDIGAYTLLAAAIWIVTNGAAGLGDDASPPARRTPARARVARFGCLVAGAGVIGLPVLIYLISTVPLEDLSLQLIVYPATVYPGTRALPFPSLVAPISQILLGGRLAEALDQASRAVALYSPWLIAAWAGIRLWRERDPARAGRPDAFQRSAATLVVLVVLIYGIKSTIRPHIPHVAHVLPPAFILAGLLASARIRGGRSLRLAAPLALVVALSYAPLHALLKLPSGSTLGARLVEDLVDPEAGTRATTIPGLPGPVELPPAATPFRLDADQLAAVDFIRTHTVPTDRLFVGNTRHDLAFGSDVLFYFLADRTSATRHHEFNPGVTTTAAVQAEIVRALRAEDVPYIVRTDRFDRFREPNQSSVSSGVHDLDRFLQLNYVPVARVGRYEIARRREQEH